MKTPPLTLPQRVTKMMEGIGTRRGGKPISQAELGRIAGVKRATVTLWMNGATQTVSYEAALLIERREGYRAKWVMHGEGDERVDSKITKIGELMEQLEDKDRSKLLAIARTFVQEAQEPPLPSVPETVVNRPPTLTKNRRK